jgi:hypothetical protein
MLAVRHQLSTLSAAQAALTQRCLSELLNGGQSVLAAAAVVPTRGEVLALLAPDEALAEQLELLAAIPEDVFAAACAVDDLYACKVGAVPSEQGALGEVVLHCRDVVFVCLVSSARELGLIVACTPSAQLGVVLWSLRGSLRTLQGALDDEGGTP